MEAPERHRNALRLLEEATRQLVLAAAQMHSKGVDTAPLSWPTIKLGEAIKLLGDDNIKASRENPPAEERTLNSTESVHS